MRVGLGANVASFLANLNSDETCFLVHLPPQSNYLLPPLFPASEGLSIEVNTFRSITSALTELSPMLVEPNDERTHKTDFQGKCLHATQGWFRFFANLLGRWGV